MTSLGAFLLSLALVCGTILTVSVVKVAAWWRSLPERPRSPMLHRRHLRVEGTRTLAIAAVLAVWLSIRSRSGLGGWAEAVALGVLVLALWGVSAAVAGALWRCVACRRRLPTRLRRSGIDLRGVTVCPSCGRPPHGEPAV